MAEKITPLHDRVLLKRVESEQTSSGGIIIPDTAQEKTQIGVIEAVGAGKVLHDGTVKALQVKAGDKVLFGKYSGTEIKLEGQDFLILKEDEILGIVKG
jgi:chaperonin GroES